MTKARFGPGAAASEPPARPWQERLADPDEALFTCAVAADLLGIDVQTLRRLDASTGEASNRPSGNQRRYSRRDVERLERAAQLRADGISGRAVEHILDLERQIASRPTKGS